MIWIQKGDEPTFLTQYKRQPHVYYDGYSHKEDLREALLRDQGYICAYCMRRIKNDRNTMKIEHWKPQSKLNTEIEKLDFQIMLGVCDGCRGAKDQYTTCDEHRHESELYVNPLHQDTIDAIYYNWQGEIKSENKRINDDLDKILNLNCEQAPSRIVQNRKAVYEECMKQLTTLKRNGKLNANTLRKILQRYEQPEDGKKQEFVGVPIYLLKKYLQKCQG